MQIVEKQIFCLVHEQHQHIWKTVKVIVEDVVGSAQTHIFLADPYPKFDDFEYATNFFPR